MLMLRETNIKYRKVEKINLLTVLAKTGKRKILINFCLFCNSVTTCRKDETKPENAREDSLSTGLRAPAGGPSSVPAWNFLEEF
jgi:hypothetical protein